MTKRTLAAALAALLLLVSAGAEIIFEDADIMGESYGGVLWDFPVALTDMEPKYVVLANKTMLLSKKLVPDPLVTVKARKADKADTNTNGGVLKASGSKMQLEETALNALVTMSEAARAEGIKLYLKSAYRSYQTQSTMYSNRLKKNNGKDDGWVSKPGASDHQTGLGMDVVSYSWRDRAMNSDFAKTKEAQWMAENCAAYGFILRYPKDKTDITEINYEPWHLRYVGEPAARYIMGSGLCLEEFCEQLWAACTAFIGAGGDPALVEPFLQVSAEN